MLLTTPASGTSQPLDVVTATQTMLEEKVALSEAVIWL